MDMILWLVVVAIAAAIAYLIINSLTLPANVKQIIWLVLLLIVVVVVLGPLFGVFGRPVLVR